MTGHGKGAMDRSSGLEGGPVMGLGIGEAGGGRGLSFPEGERHPREGGGSQDRGPRHSGPFNFPAPPHEGISLTADLTQSNKPCSAFSPRSSRPPIPCPVGPSLPSTAHKGKAELRGLGQPQCQTTPASELTQFPPRTAVAPTPPLTPNPGCRGHCGTRGGQDQWRVVTAVPGAASGRCHS